MNVVFEDAQVFPDIANSERKKCRPMIFALIIIELCDEEQIDEGDRENRRDRDSSPSRYRSKRLQAANAVRMIGT